MKEVWESLRAEMETQAKLFSQLSADIDEQVAKQLAQTRDEQGKQRKNVWFPCFTSLSRMYYTDSWRSPCSLPNSRLRRRCPLLRRP